jgi:hypothetical protein
MAKSTRTHKQQTPELVGTRVWYVAVSAHGCEPVITSGTITAVERTRKGALSIFVEPDVERQDGWVLFGKWRSIEEHIIGVVEAAA